jgi:hypothetical protein
MVRRNRSGTLMNNMQLGRRVLSRIRRFDPFLSDDGRSV